MKTATAVWVVIGVLLVAGGWYLLRGSGTAVENTAPETALGVRGSEGQTNTGTPVVPPVVSIRKDAALGEFLTASNGMTVYLYTKDTKGVSNCSGTCAVNWPPYIRTANEPLLPGAAVSGVISTITRADGGEQVTYNGAPLYFWKNDKQPGDTTGQNVGGVWFVVKP